MGWVAERVGVRWTVVGGASMVLLGLMLSVGGSPWELYVGHGLLIGLFGNAALNAPIYVYVSRWFQRRRGTALSLISSGQYIAGALWPPIFERTIALFGWRSTMVGFGFAAATVIIPLALINLKASPPNHQPTSLSGCNAKHGNATSALSPNGLFLSLLIASFLCCIPMAMPSAHLIAFCGDLGMLPVRGALALSMLLVCAFISRQFWGWVSDRYGGLPTLVVCSAVQAAATAGFVFTQSEAGLFAVAALFGLGFSGLIPAYILTVRELFPAEQAYWRVPMVFFFGMSGMATGSWGAGLIYDYTGSYAPAFATGLIANLVNLAILLPLFTWRATRAGPALA
jgi:MFS family permease